MDRRPTATKDAPPRYHTHLPVMSSGYWAAWTATIYTSKEISPMGWDSRRAHGPQGLRPTRIIIRVRRRSSSGLCHRILPGIAMTIRECSLNTRRIRRRLHAFHLQSLGNTPSISSQDLMRMVWSPWPPFTLSQWFPFNRPFAHGLLSNKSGNESIGWMTFFIDSRILPAKIVQSFANYGQRN